MILFYRKQGQDLTVLCYDIPPSLLNTRSIKIIGSNNAQLSNPYEPIYRADDNELTEFIRHADSPSGLRTSLTVFGYPLKTAMSKDDTVHYLLQNGLEALMDTWQFYDREDNEWHNCPIVEAKQDYVTVKISDYGHPNVRSMLNIEHPDKLKIQHP